MKITELDATFIKRTGKKSHMRVDDIAEADGVRFLCPKCFTENGGAVGTHSVICWGPNVNRKVEPGPGRWTLVGTGLDDLTLDGALGKSRSVQLLGGCAWHGYITEGEATGA